jgi:tricorn protease
MLTRLAALLLLLLSMAVHAAGPEGYYRFPALSGDTLVFCAEGDLWQIDIAGKTAGAASAGGTARRITSHSGEESNPAISPDGATLAFSAQYEGPTEVYTIPLSGGLPTRRTFEGGRALVVGWTPDAKVLYSTARFSTLPSTQLATIDPATGRKDLLPLAQASDGAYDDGEKSLYFTRIPFQGSHTKRYQGGKVQSLWKFTAGEPEAVALTADYPGTSTAPMWWQGRVYFVTDRDGTMNIWSMTPAGKDLQQHTHHEGLDVKSPSLSRGRIAYQLGADLWLLDIASGKTARIPITLDTDFDQQREHWIKKPIDYLTSAHLSPDADRVVLTARGQVFVAPRRQGRLVEATRAQGVRYRDARFMPGGEGSGAKDLLLMSDQSGEVEFWTAPANGVGSPTQLTKDGEVLRWEGLPSPDGHWLAHHDKNWRLFVQNLDTGAHVQIAESTMDQFSDLAWSPDSRWLAFVQQAKNTYRQIKLYEIATATTTALTTDRFDSFSPAWSPDGKWLYLLSDRSLKSVVPGPWGPLEPEPFFDKRTKIYHVALRAGERSPFDPADELHAGSDGDKKKDDEKPAKDEKTQDKKAALEAFPPAPSGGDVTGPRVTGGVLPAGNTRPDRISSEVARVPQPPAKDEPKPDEPKKDKKDKPKPEVLIDLDNIQSRLQEVPVPAGNYNDLVVTDKRLIWISHDTAAPGEAKRNLVFAPIDNKDVEVKTLIPDIKLAELSADRKSILIRKADILSIIDSSASAPADLDKKNVDLSGWTFSITPREEWRQMFTEGWRLERDYFYDRKMHGLDWPAIRDKYQPMVDRVSTRADLSDLVAQMVAELSALHTFVRGGDLRKGEDQITPAALGALLRPDEKAGGLVIDHIYRCDPDLVDRISPLAKPDLKIKDGDVIEQINGRPALSVPDPQLLLRNLAGKQVLLHIRSGAMASDGTAAADPRPVIVTPISPESEADLRYHEWEYTRRLEVDKLAQNKIGYVHLRAMGGDNIAEWARNFYPVFNRQGLIIDVRNNRGGNIDSWILARLMRKAWFYWQGRVGDPTWNMQYAFRGHMVVLCNEGTASDGEAFTEGFRRLGLGKVIGTRTWGGEIWLSSSNVLVDQGIATAAEDGVYGPEGVWLIEGHGVDPDITVDNLPCATFKGDDAQLAAAIRYLQEKIEKDPVPVPPAPAHPDKSLRAPGKVQPPPGQKPDGSPR